MTRQDEVTLENAVSAMRAQAPGEAQLAASAERVALRIGVDAAAGPTLDSTPIENCDDVQRLLAAYRAGTLSPARSMLIEAHLHDCGNCLRQVHSGDAAAAIDWSTPKQAPVLAWRPRKLGWQFGGALAATVALAASSFFAYKAYWQVPPGVRAQVESIDGTAYRISANGGRLLASGDVLNEGDQIRTSGGARAVLRLADGSTVEMNERSVLGVGARGRSMTVSLDDGALIVQAAKRTSGHLYVKTPDCRVAVVGTVFSVNSGIKGSRVAVLQGTVHVEHLGADSTVAAGGQFESNDNLDAAPVAQQIAWSRDRDKYLPLLAQLAVFRDRVQQIPSAPLRYSSDLLLRVPANTLLYVSIPNFGDFLSQADKIFDDQLKQSPALQQWWGKGDGPNTAELDAVIDRLHRMTQFLGSEIVVAAMKQGPAFAVIADVTKPGLDQFLKQPFPGATSNLPLTVFDEQSLASAKVADDAPKGGYALIRQHEAVFSNSVATLKQIDAQLNAGDSGFAASSFGQQIAAAYTRGAGVILAADLHGMMAAHAQLLKAGTANGRLETVTGMDGVEYLIAEHREVSGQPQNHLNLQFSGTRQRVASWLGAPAPMGSLGFVSPNASVAISLLSKDPKEIANDLIAMTSGDEGEKAGSRKDGSDFAEQMKANLRDNIAANLGGDFLVSLDGPVLPTPSWKAVVEVHDAQKMEQTLESITNFVRTMVGQNSDRNSDKDKAQPNSFKGLAIEPSDVDSQRYYAIRNLSSQSIVAEYTFSDGYMIVAPTRALLIEALHTHATGDSLAHSASFKALLPKDDHDNYSAIAYQNLSPVLSPLLSQFSGEQADAIRKLAADSKPTAVCAWGRDNRIEAESDSSLLGFDFLTLGAMLHGGNNSTAAPVKE